MAKHTGYKGRDELAGLTLGKVTHYEDQYAPQLLQGVVRTLNREELGIGEQLPFEGEDLWNMYELSWLNAKGKPMVATGTARFACTSRNLVESKSFKLYLNSFNQTKFPDIESVRQTIERDLSHCAQGDVRVELFPVDGAAQVLQPFKGELIDSLDIEVEQYQLTPSLLEEAASGELVEETLVSHLLKSNCLITSQPDWASLQIHYLGRKIDREKLLRYVISFRQHNEFHEQCVERIFTDISRYCQPQKLSVYARYTRRGGLDINPMRSNFSQEPENIRLVRQ